MLRNEVVFQVMTWTNNDVCNCTQNDYMLGIHDNRFLNKKLKRRNIHFNAILNILDSYRIVVIVDFSHSIG